jgi:NitT/TauT family transport system permease protein
MGLVWNSMMSMAGGWFFLMINEAFKLGDKDYRLPGVGSYMSLAVERRDHAAMLWAILAMTLMIVGLDQLLWRPVVVWAQKFRVEESGQQEAMTSWFLDWLRRSRLVRYARRVLHHLPAVIPAGKAAPAAPRPLAPSWGKPLSLVALLALVAALGYGVWLLLGILGDVGWAEWRDMALDAGLTLGRVLVATVLGTLWAVPAGLAIGLSPRLSRLLQPVVQVVASFPAPMLFPLVVGALTALGWTLDWVSIVLMLLGTQWYILFNVIAGAMAVPADLREAARSYRITGWQRFWWVYLPSIFPYLVTGWVTAAGGAWNASIVAEYLTYDGQVLQAHGLGARITAAAEEARFPLLAASVLVMSVLVVAFNRVVWKRLYQLSERRFSLNR